jgi:putative FmdB family regulatory protein
VVVQTTKEDIMPVYEFECDNCGFISERFYPAIPRVDPMQIVKVCDNCKFEASHKKLMSNNSFHLKGGKSPWGEGRHSSASKKSTDVVELDEP